jgi:hypothetical protein
MRNTAAVEGDDGQGASSESLFASFTGAVGLALGELLLVLGKTEDLGWCLRSIGITAQATLLSSDLQPRGASMPRPSCQSLAGAALRVVRTWHEDIEDLSGLGEAIALLQDVLEAMGVRYVPAPFYEGCSND